jgi:hypothetical protein
MNGVFGTDNRKPKLERSDDEVRQGIAARDVSKKVPAG